MDVGRAQRLSTVKLATAAGILAGPVFLTAVAYVIGSWSDPSPYPRPPFVLVLIATVPIGLLYGGLVARILALLALGILENDPPWLHRLGNSLPLRGRWLVLFLVFVGFPVGVWAPCGAFVILNPALGEGGALLAVLVATLCPIAFQALWAASGSWFR